MNAPESKIEVPTTFGAPCGGGFFYGRIIDGDHLFALIVAPKDGGEHDDTIWNMSLKAVAGACSYFDGMANTRAMARGEIDVEKLRIAAKARKDQRKTHCDKGHPMSYGADGGWRCHECRLAYWRKRGQEN